MKVQVFFTAAFIFLLAVSLLTLVSPLAFTNIWIRNVTYLVTILLSFFVARQVENRFFRFTISWLPLVVFMFLSIYTLFFSFANYIYGNWTTTSISHRKGNDQRIYIGQEMRGVGAFGYTRRTVKVIPITPFFKWVTIADTGSLGMDWKRVSEEDNLPSAY